MLQRTLSTRYSFSAVALSSTFNTERVHKVNFDLFPQEMDRSSWGFVSLFYVVVARDFRVIAIQ